MKHKLLLSALVIASVTMNAVAQNAPVVSTIRVSQFRMPANVKPGDYLEKTVIFRLKPQFRDIISPSGIGNMQLAGFLNSIGAPVPARKFPNHQSPEKPFNERGEKLEDLSLIYSFTYTADTPLEKVINALYSLGIFEYAEPYYVPKPCYTPNDPSITFEYHLTKLDAFNAWNLYQGDTNVVIGITDTGIEFTHSDLTNVKYNPNDPVNGVDDDGDGYIDNYRGWDLGENDNDPSYNANAHGVHVTGLAAATTDNGIGMAGVSFKSRFLPVKIANATGALTMAYDGIVYAADHGCAIINCSWGGAGGGQFGQNIINYATYNKNSLVVAAAGNNGIFEDFYPASYDLVISVAGTNNNDQKWSGSNFSYNVDVCAPGDAIYSTWPSNTYTISSGTSMASPIAAGAAAMIKAMNPSYTALQVGEHLKVTCENIYPLNNPTYADKLGTGRVDLFNALSGTSSPSVVNTLRNITDNNDNAFVANDTLRITGDFTNYLSPTTNLTVTLSTTSSYVTIIDGTTTLGAIGTLATANNNSDAFTVKINPTAPLNQSILFKLTMTDGSYSAVQYFNVTVNVDYINIAIGDVGTTITSKGLIGYNMDQQQQGLGFTYMGGVSHLYEASLMVGTSSSKVSDRARSTTATPDADFISAINVHRVIPSVISEFDVEGEFTDNAASSPLPVHVAHSAYAWSIPGHRKYVIVNYEITNTGSAPLNNLHAGIFADWDILNYNNNKAAFDNVNMLGYCWSTDSSLYMGTKLLTPGPVLHYAIDNVSGGGGGVNLFDGYDTAEKFTTLSTNRPAAGNTVATGNDVCQVVSSGPFSLNAGDSVVVAFALIAGDSLLDLQNSAINAQLMYDSVPVGLSSVTGSSAVLFQNYPNPAAGATVIEVSMAYTEEAELNIYNVMGQQVASVYKGQLQQGRHQFIVDLSRYTSGMYYYTLRAGDAVSTKKMIVTR